MPRAEEMLRNQSVISVACATEDSLLVSLVPWIRGSEGAEFLTPWLCIVFVSDALRTF
jgi:hypothetical protein